MNSQFGISSRSGLTLLVAISSVAWGCGGATTDDATTTSSVRASLRRTQSCGDLLSGLQADAAFKVNHAIDEQIASTKQCIALYGDGACVGGYVGMGIGGVAGGDANAATAAPSVPAADNNSASGGTTSSGDTTEANEPGASDHSDTNVQVAGVDEADIVKTDGTNLYLIHGRTFKVIKAWPATDLTEVSSFDLEGQPTEMFVADNTVVVYSNVNGAAVYAAAGVQPKATYYDYGYAYASNAIAPQAYAPLTKITVLTLSNNQASLAREIYFEGNFVDARRVGPNVRTVLSGSAHGPALKYSIYDLYPDMGAGAAPPDAAAPPTNAATPADAGPTTAVDAGPATPADGGTAVMSQRVAATTVTYPTTGTAFIKALEQLRAANLDIIAKSQITDWLPYTFEKQNDQVTTETVACENFYVPTAGSTETGFTEIAAIDLDNPSAPPKQTAIVGYAQTVYGTADTLYLAATAWIEPPIFWGWASSGSGSTGSGSTGSTGGSSVGSSTDPAQPNNVQDGGEATLQAVHLLTSPAVPTTTAYSTNSTHVHKFEFTTDPTFPNYVASGTVPGSVKDQFSLDDQNGYLRIATNESITYVDSNQYYVMPSADLPSSVNHVTVLGVHGGWLDEVGNAGPLAPNETIYSVRFVGNRGYVVTFRQMDPLFVIDLTQPEQPVVLGALTIPGFSEYMHPIDDNHLLTIGRGGTNAQALALKIFDVTNGKNPVLTQQFTYNNEYGYSDAEYDHKAFTYLADRQLLAFPYYGYSPSDSGGMRSSLELFKVDLASGFTRLGSIDNSSLGQTYPTGYYCGYYGPQVRRGVFLESYAYSISYGGIVVKDTNASPSDFAATAPVTLSLPVPTIDTANVYGAPAIACMY
ncbi:MAG: beta-propeller domain-containing protein [Polyangiaceae bacterium]|nr:beta-propeller domain-containing protein [Polyangiaceae bacterium]